MKNLKNQNVVTQVLLEIGLAVANFLFNTPAFAIESLVPLGLNSNQAEFRMIPAGGFQRGSSEDAARISQAFPRHEKAPEYFSDEFPVRFIKISKPFYCSTTEVTVGQFRRFVEATQYVVESERDGTGGWGFNVDSKQCEGRSVKYSWHDVGCEQTDQQPVVNVTWNDAVAYCEWLSQKEKRIFRLPTEAEWEYCCRAGGTTRYSLAKEATNSPDDLLRQSRVLNPKLADPSLHVQDMSLSADGSIRFTEPVASYAANAFGLFDTHGNVWEWTSDWYGEDYYRNSPSIDPSGPSIGIVKVRRGGAWNSFPLWARASFRNWNRPDSRCVNLGFRVVAEATAYEVQEFDRQQPVSILFVGDIMLDNGPGHVIASGKDPFVGCADLLLDPDLTIGNLECVLGRGGEQLNKAYVFRAASDSPKYLRMYFDGLSLANNHSADFGSAGFAEAIDVMRRESLPYFGGGKTIDEARAPLVLECKGRRIAFLGYNDFRMLNYAATEKEAGSAPMIKPDVLADIRLAKNHGADFVIPFVHWGNEMIPMPMPDQRQFAKEMIDAGACAVIGSHPHIPQTVDVYRGAPIIYSLGNFVFDYYPVDPPEWLGWATTLNIHPNGQIDLQTTALQMDAAGLPTPVNADP